MPRLPRDLPARSRNDRARRWASGLLAVLIAVSAAPGPAGAAAPAIDVVGDLLSLDVEGGTAVLRLHHHAPAPSLAANDLPGCITVALGAGFRLRWLDGLDPATELPSSQVVVHGRVEIFFSLPFIDSLDVARAVPTAAELY